MSVTPLASHTRVEDGTGIIRRSTRTTRHSASTSNDPLALTR